MTNPVLQGLLEELEGVCLNIVTYNKNQEESYRTYADIRSSIIDNFGLEALPSVVRANRHGAALRASAQRDSAYSDRRQKVWDSFVEVFDGGPAPAAPPPVAASVAVVVTPASAPADGSKPPQPLPDYFHPDLLSRCSVAYNSGDYSTAILLAFRYIEVRVRELAQLPDEDIGLTLMTNAIGPRNQRLRFSEHASEQDGYHQLFRAAIGMLKNPLSHKEVAHPDWARTLERLAFASMLLKDLDDATIQIPAVES